METLKDIFTSSKTVEECQRNFSILFGTDDIIVDYDIEVGFKVSINYSIEIRQELSDIIIAYRQEYGCGDPYMLLQIERQMIEAYFALIEVFQIVPEIKDAGQEPINEVSIFYEFNDFSIENTKEFIELASTIDSIFLSRFVKGICPDVGSRYYSTIYNIHNQYLKDISLSNICMLKRHFISLEVISILLGSGLETIDSTFSLFNPFKLNYKYFNQNYSINFGLYEDSKFEEEWEEAKLYIELQDFLILEIQNRIFITNKLGYDIIKKLTSLCYIYGRDFIEFFINSNYELVIKNSVFFTRQKVFIVDIDYSEKILGRELDTFKESLAKVYKKKLIRQEDIVKRFQELINNPDTNEQQLEKYLEINFQTFFGVEYNECICQAKIFKNMSKNEKKEERRLDIALYDLTRDDWEIVELKKSNINLVRTIREIPVFHSAVTVGIAQLQYYKKMLQQDDIKKQLFIKYGIKMDSPKFTLIIGNSLTKEAKECIDQVQGIEIKTYKQVLEKAKLSISGRLYQ